jgi:hypothetical protein
MMALTSPSTNPSGYQKPANRLALAGGSPVLTSASSLRRHYPGQVQGVGNGSVALSAWLPKLPQRIYDIVFILSAFLPGVNLCRRGGMVKNMHPDGRRSKENAAISPHTIVSGGLASASSQLTFEQMFCIIAFTSMG